MNSFKHKGPPSSKKKNFVYNKRAKDVSLARS
jgi:hypothetical protein